MYQFSDRRPQWRGRASTALRSVVTPSTQTGNSSQSATHAATAVRREPGVVGGHLAHGTRERHDRDEARHHEGCQRHGHGLAAAADSVVVVVEVKVFDALEQMVGDPLGQVGGLVLYDGQQDQTVGHGGAFTRHV
jgi:hypothetical protein